MFGRCGCFVLLVLLLDPSSSLKICDIDLQWHEDFLKNQTVSIELVIEAAEVLLSIFEKNPDLAKEYSSTLKFVKQLLQTRPEVIATNLAYFGAILYLVTIIVTSYCFLVDSQNKLYEAEHNKNKLDIIEAEVGPILNHIELLLKSPDANGLSMVCSKETNVKQMLKDFRFKIQNIANTIKLFRQKSTEGKEQSRALKVTSVVLAGAAICAVIAAPIAAPAGVVVAGGFGIGGILGYQRFDESQNKYDEALSVLKKAKGKAVNAEKAIAMLQTSVELACSLGLKRLESKFKWSLLLEAEEKKEIGSKSINYGLKRVHN